MYLLEQVKKEEKHVSNNLAPPDLGLLPKSSISLFAESCSLTYLLNAY